MNFTISALEFIAGFGLVTCFSYYTSVFGLSKLPVIISLGGYVVSQLLKMQKGDYNEKLIKNIKLYNLVNEYIVKFDELHDKIINNNTITNDDYNEFLNLYKDYEIEVRNTKEDNDIELARSTIRNTINDIFKDEIYNTLKLF